MSGPNYVKQPTIQRLPTQLEEIRNGHLLIPRFQRPFVWTDAQRLNLLDSVYKGMPIGSILVWRTYNHRLSCYDQLGPLRIATEPPSDSEVKQYLIDGHQRLTTLYVAFHSGDDDSADEPIEDEDGKRQWPICFDLESQSFKLHPKNGDPPRTWVPLSLLFDSFRLFEFQKELFDLENGRDLAKRAEALASIFKDYSIAVVPIVSEDLETVTTSFQRINSAGTPMSRVHMVSALTWSPQFDLNRKFRGIHEELSEVGWDKLEDENILNVCKLRLGLDGFSSNVDEIKTRIKEHPEVIEDVTARLKRAAEYLRARCGVHGPDALPYRLQIVALAHVLEEAMDDSVLEALRKWFWVVTYTEYLGSGTNSTRFARAIEHIKKVVGGGADPIPPEANTTIKPLELFYYPNGRARAMALRLSRRGPRTPSGKRFGAAKKLGSAGNRILLRVVRRQELELKQIRSMENRIVLEPAQLRRFRHKLGNGELDPGILDSHAIPADAATAYAAGDYAEFLRLRRRFLLDQEEAFVASFGLTYDRTGAVDGDADTADTAP